MAGDENEEKKHAPGEKGWRDSAEKGQIPKSQDLTSLAVLIAGFAGCAFGAPYMGSQVRWAMDRTWDFGRIPHRFTHDHALDLFATGSQAIVIGAMVPLSLTALAAILVNLAQTQGQLAPKALEPDIKRLNPISGFQNHYMSWTPLVELGKGVLKLFVLAAVTFFLFRSDISTFPGLAVTSAGTYGARIAEVSWRLILAATPLLLLVGAADYAYSYYKLYQQLKRTDQQLKDETKQQDGDPHVKAQRRALARRYATRSLIAAVAEADVVVTNPTHYAVALRYDSERDAAPIVLAKGVDHLAQVIKAEARSRDIPRIEDRPLARALHARVEPGFPIPEDLFLPVAKVLAVVYRRRAARRAGAGGATRTPGTTRGT